MENKSHAFVAGLFTLLLGLAAVSALYWLGGQKEETRTYTVVTRQNVTGLNQEGQVRYRGIRVGKVSDIRLDPQDMRNILIDIQIDKGVPVTRGTVAKLGFQGITGIAHIMLEEKSDGDAVDAELMKNERIAMLPSLLDELGDSGAATLSQIRQFMVSANALLNEENRKRISSILIHLESSSAKMEPALESLDKTLAQVKRLLSDENIQKFSRVTGEAGPLLAETRTLVGRLSSTAEKLDAAIGDASSSGAAALMPRLNELSTDLSTTSRQLNRVLKVIEESPQSLVFGAAAPPPGPGEPGFSPPHRSGKGEGQKRLSAQSEM